MGRGQKHKTKYKQKTLKNTEKKTEKVAEIFNKKFIQIGQSNNVPYNLACLHESG